MNYTDHDIDILTRTVLGEAAGENDLGQVAVVNVIRNRLLDSRWPNSLSEVALQPKQFSAWNEGVGGNSLTDKYNPGHPVYERAKANVLRALSSDEDPTAGATHYYSPSGMKAHIERGEGTVEVPGWLKSEQERRGGGDPLTIGNHVFTGLREGADAPPMPMQYDGVPPVQEAATENEEKIFALDLAAKQMGMNERAQREALQEYMANGGHNLDPSVTAWCAAYVGATLNQVGLQGTGKLNARSYLDWGEAVDEPKPGDIAVFSRGDPNGWQGHVGFFKGYDENGNILVLGGNQGDSVSVAPYSADRLLGFRRMAGLHPEDVPPESGGSSPVMSYQPTQPTAPQQVAGISVPSDPDAPLVRGRPPVPPIQEGVPPIQEDKGFLERALTEDINVTGNETIDNILTGGRDMLASMGGNYIKQALLGGSNAPPPLPAPNLPPPPSPMQMSQGGPVMFKIKRKRDTNNG